MPTMIRVVYCSKASSDLGPADIEQILNSARRNNKKNHITGLLVFDNQYFLQVLEGERQQVSELVTKISTDQRHQKFCFISVSTICLREFSHWSMAYVSKNKLKRDLLIKYSVTDEFAPYNLTADSALMLLKELAKEQDNAE